MTLRSRIRSWATAVLRRSRMESEMDAELRSHIELYAEDLVRSGIPREEAMRRARIEFGGIETTKEQCRDARGLHITDTFFQDLRFGLRLLRKSPGFTAVAVLTLGLGIGANSAIFSVVNAVLLRPLPYADPGRLVLLPEANSKANIPEAAMAYPTFVELRDHSHLFSAIAGLGGHALVLTGHGEPSEVSTVVVTSQFFSVLSARPQLGRVFVAADNRHGVAPVAVVSEGLWRSRFGADPGIVGRSISLDMRPYTVIGVMPASFHTPFINRTNQVWIPLAQDPLFSAFTTRPPREHWLAVIARVRPGIRPGQMKAELGTISARLARQFPAEKGWAIGTQPLQKEITGGVRLPLLLLLCAVGLVLLIACANIANLLLTRAMSRSREIAIRIALGAGKRRIAFQLLTECVILGLLGAVAGILLAYLGVAALVPLLPSSVPRFHSVRVDGWVLGFALALSLLAALGFGLAPLLFAARSNPQGELAEGGARAGEAAGPRRARAVLAAAEVALAVVLLVGAGLLIRSFSRLTSVRPGFETNHVVKAMVSLPQFQYSSEQQWTAFAKELMNRLQAQPGMQTSAIMAPMPIVDPPITLPFQIAGGPLPRPGQENTADYVTASPGYFAVMEIPLLRGRLFDESDTSSSPPVTVISEALVKRYFRNQDPLGRHLTFAGFPAKSAASREIVGIVGDIHDVSLGKRAEPMLYVPFAQAPLYGGEVVVRSTLGTSAIVGAIRDVTHSIDKNLPVTDIASLPNALNESLAQPRLRAFLLGLFSAMALLLAAVGIFGVISYSVSYRTRELGIRMALGAQPGAILRMVLRETLGLSLTGLAVGVPCALGAGRLITHLLFDVKSYDPVSLLLVALVLVAVSGLAGYIPARRAMRIDPIAALRYE